MLEGYKKVMQDPDTDPGCLGCVFDYDGAEYSGCNAPEGIQCEVYREGGQFVEDVLESWIWAADGTDL